MSGWIKIHRKIKKWEWYDDTNTFRLFFHLLISANFEDRQWQGVAVKRGELITSRAKLAQETGLSDQQTRTAESNLKSTNSLRVESTNKYSKYIIVNYNDYQTGEDEITNENEAEQQTDNKQITNKATTTKEDKNIRKDTLPTLSLETTPAEQADLLPDPAIKFFPIFWEFFPKKRAGSQDKAKVAFLKACGRDKVEVILNGVKRYAASDEVKRGFAKGAAAWLTDDRWKHEYEPAKSDKPMGETIKRMGQGWKD